MSTLAASHNRERRLEDALDACLHQLNEGASIEACLAKYPALEAELEPLLVLALRIQGLRSEPRPATLQAGKERLLREAARLEQVQSVQAKARRFPPIWLSFQPLLRRSMAAVTLASLLLVVVLGRGAIAASANSLPGDTLYAVKRVSEEVRLLLTFDQQLKVQFSDQLDARRREEAKALAERQRVVEMSFRGWVEAVGSGRLTVSGVSVETSEETTVEGDVAVGALVRVHILSRSDGTLLALRIVAEPQEAAPQPTATASATQLPPTPTPTRTALPTQVPPTSAPAQPPQQIAPTSTSRPTATPRPTFTPSPTATLVPTTPAPPRQVKVRFTGSIEAIDVNAWRVGGQVVKVDANTNINEQDGKAAIGATATVVALRMEDGGLFALEITIERAAQATEQPYEFQGLIEAYGPTEWVVGGHRLTITENTIIENAPRQGLLAEVKALRRSDGALVAIHILVKLPTEVVQFEGDIQSIGAGQWTVAGITVHLDAETVIIGAPALGSLVEVEGLLLPDDTVLARRIVIQLPATATATPKPLESPVGTATAELPSLPTLTPSAQAMPSRTPTSSDSQQPPPRPDRLVLPSSLSLKTVEWGDPAKDTGGG